MHVTASTDLIPAMPLLVNKGQSHTDSTMQFSQGFFPLMPKLMEPNASLSWQAYLWQKGDFFRVEALKKACSNSYLGFLFCRLFRRTNINLTAMNVFSIFAQNTVEGRSADFQAKFLASANEEKGVLKLREKIAEILTSNGKKGLACYCKMNIKWDPSSISKDKVIPNQEWDSLMELVMEITPGKNINIYNSYAFKGNQQYTFEQQLENTLSKNHVDYTLDTFDILMAYNPYYYAFKWECFWDIFNVAEFPKFCSFSFIPLEYDTKDIPVLARKITLLDRVKHIWQTIVDRVAAIFSRISQPFNRKVAVG